MRLLHQHFQFFVVRKNYSLKISLLCQKDVQLYIFFAYIYSAIFDGSWQYFYQLTLAYCVKELFQIHIYHIYIAIVYILLALSEGIMRSSLWSETEAVFWELLLIDWR